MPDNNPLDSKKPSPQDPKVTPPPVGPPPPAIGNAPPPPPPPLTPSPSAPLATPPAGPEPKPVPDQTPFSTENIAVPPPPIIEPGPEKGPEKTDKAALPDLPPIISPESDKKLKFNKKKTIPTILGILVLVGGISAGVFMTQRNQELRESAEVIIQANCSYVKAYMVEGDESDTANWFAFSTADLNNLHPGSEVYLTVVGTAEYPQDPQKLGFDQAEFSINDIKRPATTKVKPRGASDPAKQVEFYDIFEIPTGETTFDVTASLHHTIAGWAQIQP